MSSAIGDFFTISSGSKTAKFDVPGRTHAGTIMSISNPEPQTDFETKLPIPGKMQIRVTIATDEREDGDPDDDGQRTVYVASGWMRGAIAEAVRAAGVEAPKVGGFLSVTYTGLVPNSRAKNYTATYKDNADASTAAFLGTGDSDDTPPAGIDKAAWAAMPADAKASVRASMGGATSDKPPF